ncbi:hypothetical protein EVAR_80026_1 [Eumeta japonica]|uniref:Uncharacterized protein n=1 Tax=Eumeta variegata TaxID=151549 RepID=A0A4C1WKZ6_EUMVA|nr:hypothetical protein EVAR_80026_1 [Eumeta japonica]
MSVFAFQYIIQDLAGTVLRELYESTVRSPPAVGIGAPPVAPASAFPLMIMHRTLSVTTAPGTLRRNITAYLVQYRGQVDIDGSRETRCETSADIITSPRCRNKQRERSQDVDDHGNRRDATVSRAVVTFDAYLYLIDHREAHVNKVRLSKPVHIRPAPHSLEGDALL